MTFYRFIGNSVIELIRMTQTGCACYIAICLFDIRKMESQTKYYNSIIEKSKDSELK